MMEDYIKNFNLRSNHDSFMFLKHTFSLGFECVFLTTEELVTKKIDKLLKPSCLVEKLNIRFLPSYSLNSLHISPNVNGRSVKKIIILMLTVSDVDTREAKDAQKFSQI